MLVVAMALPRNRIIRIQETSSAAVTGYQACLIVPLSTTTPISLIA